jgi:hypothetical protein
MDEKEKRLLLDALRLLDILEEKILEETMTKYKVESEVRRSEHYARLMGLVRAKGLILDATYPENERVWK